MPKSSTQTSQEKQPLQAPSATIEDLLWNNNISPQTYGTENLYYEHIFHQYRIFVEMADKISARRNIANTFFLTLHTTLVSLASFFFENSATPWLSLFPLIAALVLCYAWWRLMKSYRQLNTVKYKVIGEYERRLPTSPYWNAEWTILEKGQSPRIYRPLTDIENWVPLVFAVLYIAEAITVAIYSI